MSYRNRAPISATREHYWDALRAFLMLLGIPYHTALAYRSGQEWIVHSGGGAPLFIYLAEFLHLFRMPAFFVIAGYFAALLLERRPSGEWLRDRTRRLGVPLLVSMVTLVPVMNMAGELSSLSIENALAIWRSSALTSAGYWVRHLWFLIVLLYCSTGTVLLVRCFPALKSAQMPEAVDRWTAARFLPVLAIVALVIGAWQAIAIELFYKAGMATNIPQALLRLDEFIAFAPYFAIGCILARSPHALKRLGSFSPLLVCIAIALAALDLVLLDKIPPWLGRFIGTLAAFAIIQVIIAIARRIADRESALIGGLVAASFVIYLVHMPIIIILVALGAKLPLSIAVKALSVMILSLTLSYGVWRIVVRSALLSFAFNGDRLPSWRTVLA